MRFLRQAGVFAVLVLALQASSSLAAKNDFDEEEKPWVEAEVQLPVFPESQNLIPFTVGAISDTRFLIDGDSLSVESDGVIRYTLIVISSAGAQNISFEGVRCSTVERRSYAFGRSDKTWSKARSNQWTKIRGNTNNHFVELYTNYFCTIGMPIIASGDDARRVLRNGGQVLRR